MATPKKLGLAFFFASFVIISLFADTVMAYPPFGTINIQTPEDGSTVYTDTVELSYLVAVEDHWMRTAWMTIFLDGKIYRLSELDYYRDGGHILRGRVTIANLTQGQHVIQIMGNATGGHFVVPNQVDFTINSTTCNIYVNFCKEPAISILSLKEYNTSKINIEINSVAPDSIISYGVDDQENVTLSKNGLIQNQDGYVYNVNLSGLGYGSHTLFVYTVDVLGNIGTASKSFFINIPQESEPTTQPTHQIQTTAIILGAAITTIVLSACLVLLLYRKQSHKNK